MAPLFEHYRHSRPVYAPDLPGFGLSTRRDRPYTRAFFTEVVTALLVEVERLHGVAPDVIALSLTAEFAARAITQQGAPVHSLAVISPTGLGDRPLPPERVSRVIERVVQTPVLGKGLYALLTSKASIRFFLGKAFVNAVPTRLVDYAIATTKHPDAHWAPFAFLSMRLFTDDALGTLYVSVACPVLVLYDEDPNISFERLPELLQANPAVHSVRVTPTLGMPHWDATNATITALDTFWQANPSS
jgi:pimeloyl-ACP methyl ester carboxylesterase